MNKPKLIEISDKILSYHREISDLYNEYAKSVGLTFSSFVVLGILWKESNCTQSIIIKKSCLPKQTVNSIIKGFLKQNIIKELTELETDKRNKQIRFTEYGKKFADKIMLKVQSTECQALDNLGEDKAEMLVEIIDDYKTKLNFK